MAGLLILLTIALAPVTAMAEEDPFAARRAALVEEIAADAAWIPIGRGPRAFSPPVLAAIGAVERHRFVPDAMAPHAYENRPLPIGHGQTISQPYIVALMTDLLALGAGAKVLEIGTGSGYQAAVLAELGIEVFSIEIIEPLARSATERLDRLGYKNVRTRFGDGYDGWPEEAPFDGIVVTAAADHIPPPLVQQLKPGGRMVIPVGAKFLTQQLVLVEMSEEGRVTTRQLLPVAFVPLTRR